MLATSTAFIAKRNGNFYLITNRHNVTGKDQHTEQCLRKDAAIPDMMRVYFNLTGTLGGYLCRDYSLKANCPQWFEHPVLKKDADIVAFIIDTHDERLEINPHYDLDANSKNTHNIDVQNIAITPSTKLNVIGFPFGKKSMNNFGIWSTGYLASDIDIDIDEKPQFYIDVRARKGQSGSPVVFYRQGEAVKLNNRSILQCYSGWHLLGIYCGRINQESDIGIVWKREAICELLDAIPH